MAHNNSGNNLGRAIATIAVWVAVCVLSYLFHSFGILTGSRAGWMVFAAFLLTVGLWNLD